MIGSFTDRSVTGAAFSCYALRLSLSDPEPEPFLTCRKKKITQTSAFETTAEYLTKFSYSQIQPMFYPLTYVSKYQQ